MACFFTEKAAKILEVGMQAVALSVPVIDTTAEIVEGIRDCCLPMSQNTWFKINGRLSSKRQKSVYGKFESCINDIIQVIKPADEFQNICALIEAKNHGSHKQANINNTTEIIQTRNLIEPDDIIDLTQDVPCTALKLSRSYEEDLNKKRPRKKQKNFKKPTVINLDETINLDDYSNNTNAIKPISVSKKSECKRKSLSCPICLESLSDENIKAMTTPCGHVYCLECLKTISQTKNKCSICQRKIQFGKCIRLHI